MIFPYREITPRIKRPIIRIVLKSKDTFVIYHALIDSGADYCIFSIELARALNIKLSKSKTSFRGVGKEKVQGFWGDVEIGVGEVKYKIKAIFAEISDFGHGILGQKGFFDQFDVKLSYQKQTIEIEPYINFLKSDMN